MFFVLDGIRLLCTLCNKAGHQAVDGIFIVKSSIQLGSCAGDKHSTLQWQAFLAASKFLVYLWLAATPTIWLDSSPIDNAPALAALAKSSPFPDRQAGLC